MKPFVHLHVHTWYSLLDGVCRPDEIVLAAKSRGMSAVAITDHGNMYGAFEFWSACRLHGVKPIFGCEFYLADQMSERTKDISHLTVLARTKRGLRNLFRLSTASFVDGFYHRPRIDLEILGEHAEGLTVLSGCMLGKISLLLRAGETKLAKAFYDRLSEMFPSQFYIEFMPLAIPEVVELNSLIVEFSRRHGAPVVLTNDVHYATREQLPLHRAIMFVNTKGMLEVQTKNLWLKTRAELCEILRTVYPDIDRGFLTEAMDRSVTIADSIEDLDLDTEKKFPEYWPSEKT